MTDREIRALVREVHEAAFTAGFQCGLEHGEDRHATSPTCPDQQWLLDGCDTLEITDIETWRSL